MVSSSSATQSGRSSRSRSGFPTISAASSSGGHHRHSLRSGPHHQHRRLTAAAVTAAAVTAAAVTAAAGTTVDGGLRGLSACVADTVVAASAGGRDERNHCQYHQGAFQGSLPVDPANVSPSSALG